MGTWQNLGNIWEKHQNIPSSVTCIELVLKVWAFNRDHPEINLYIKINPSKGIHQSYHATSDPKLSQPVLIFDFLWRYSKQLMAGSRYGSTNDHMRQLSKCYLGVQMPCPVQVRAFLECLTLQYVPTFLKTSYWNLKTILYQINY